MRPILFFFKKLHSINGLTLYFNQLSMSLISLLNAFGIMMIIPLINSTGILNVTGQTELPFSFLLKWINNFPSKVSLIMILSFYLVLMVGQNVFQRQQVVLNVKIIQKFLRYLKEQTYAAILEADWNFFIRNKKSDLINTMIVEVGQVATGTNTFLQFLSSLVYTFVQLILACFISIKMTLFVLICGGLSLVFSRTFLRKSQSYGKETIELSKLFLSGLTDQLNGIKEIKSNSLENWYINWFFAMSKKIETNIVNLAKVKTTSQMFYNGTSTFLIALVIFLSIQLFKEQSAQLILIVMIFSRIWPKITSIQTNLQQLNVNLPAFISLIHLQKECLDSKEIKTKINTDIEPIKLLNEIKCQHVYFSYNLNKKKYALQNITVSIPFNHMTAIVGRSGAGKSTLIDLLMGLNRPLKGEILIDGEPLNDRKLIGLRRTISYVPQDPFVFNSSIRENLNIVYPEATDEDIWEALEFAAAADFVKKLPQKLDTFIGDRGIKLSGGERQRLVLARAILKKPSILILDEATSALDTENEAMIQDAIERIRGKMTLIVIAHRLSTIRNADQVIVLDEGQVVQQGKYTQLAHDKRGVFGKLLEKQLQTTS